MPLSSLQAGNSRGLDTSVRFNVSPNTAMLAINGLVSGSDSLVQFTVNLDPAFFTCALSADRTQIIITTSGSNRNPTNVVYTVDAGNNMKTTRGGNVVMVMQMLTAGQNTGTVYTFTKATGGGGSAFKHGPTTPGQV
ncbi:MAG: hypothetical protein KA175_12715 [Flavobacteriales bacterium]|nr:hypothetical protein [Flavobacteriales bacterium]MBP6698476.1 hypothetical protein [Flavobacteriales bacterium]